MESVIVHLIWSVTLLAFGSAAAWIVYRVLIGPKVMRAEDIKKAFDDIAKALFTMSERVRVLEEADKERRAEVQSLKIDNTAGSLAHRIRNFGS